MKTFSEELREAREAKGLSLEELANSTKISLKILRAIERGNFDVLPQTYIKGFLKSYAQEVGLDSIVVARKYEDYQKATTAIFSQPPRLEKAPVKKHSWRLWTAISSLSILLLGGYLVLGRGKDRGRQIPPDIEETSGPPTQVQVQPSEADTADSDQTNDVLSGHDFESEMDSAEQTPHEIPKPVEPTDLTLTGDVLSDTWVRVHADGSILYEGILNTGTTVSWRADSLFELNIGKANGVRLVLNGRPLGELGGPDKVVRELVLDKVGIVRKVLR